MPSRAAIFSKLPIRKKLMLIFNPECAMQLVEAGKIDLDAPVTKYLPWFRTSDLMASNQITVSYLLNQDSGLEVYEGRQGIADNDQSSTALELGVPILLGGGNSVPVNINCVQRSGSTATPPDWG
jgi:Beta-lactamase